MWAAMRAAIDRRMFHRATQNAVTRRHLADAAITSVWDAAAYGCSNERARALVAMAIGESEDAVVARAEAVERHGGGKFLKFTVKAKWNVRLRWLWQPLRSRPSPGRAEPHRDPDSV